MLAATSEAQGGGLRLLAHGSEGWRYSFSTQKPDWNETDFDAVAWKGGCAPLGFGELTINTITNTPKDGEAVPITTYFRTEFHPTEECENSILRLKIRVDDGFVAYLNGTEFQRWNMPEGMITPETLATRALSAPEEQLYLQFEVDNVAIRSSRNVLAIEVHQCNSQSTDLFLDVQLDCHLQRHAHLVRTSDDAMKSSLAFNSTHVISHLTAIPDDFIDGGRGMQIDEFGIAVSDREIIRVDRSMDANLLKHLEFARSPELATLSTIDRATRIARYVDKAMTPVEGRVACESRSEYLAEKFQSREVYLGDVVDFCGAGVCRHRALLFKILADEAGLHCTVMRGNYRTSKGMAGHTWNELVLDDGSIAIVDVMNIQPDFYFPSPKEPAAGKYLTIAGSSKYSTQTGN